MKFRSYLLLLSCLSAPVWAADKELTRQIVELQALVNAQDSRISRLESALQKNEPMLNLLKEIEALNTEMARLRGDAEVQTHHLDTLEKRQKDLYVDLDGRISDLTKAATAAATPPTAANQAAGPVDPAVESSDYEAALNTFKARNYASAIKEFKAFLKSYPDSTLAPNAQYWIGYAYFAMKDYKSALAQQQKLLAVYPASSKIPDALLNIASSQIELHNRSGAKKTLEEITSKYANTPAATLATKRLATLK